MNCRLPILPDRWCQRLDVWAVTGTVGGILLAGCDIAPWMLLMLSAVSAGFVFVLMPWRRGIALVLCAAIGAGLLCWQRHPAAGSCEALLDGQNAGAVIRARVVEPGLTALPFLPPPHLIRAELIDARLVGENAFRPVSGHVYLMFPRDSHVKLAYGDIVEAGGQFRLPQDDGVMIAVNGGDAVWHPNTPWFGRYLRSRRVAAIFRADAWQTIGHEPGMMGHLMAWRDRVAWRLTDGMTPVAAKREAAALFFGCRSGIDRADRFVSERAGTIHLYSVSGLHVGLLGCLLLWCCRGLPYRWRFLIPPLPLFAYVLTTGANPPAMRAWCMIAIWSLLRALLVWMPGTAVLAWTAVGLLWLNPSSLGDVGFLYSFTITGLLLLLGSQRETAGVWSDPLPLMPASPLRQKMDRLIRWRYRSIMAVLVVATAFFGGALISGVFQGGFYWASIPANLLLMPLIAWLFPLAAAKLLFGFGWMNTALAALLSGVWAVMDGIIALAAACDTGSSCDPAWWQVGLFYGGFAALLMPRAVRWVRISGGAAMAMVILTVILMPAAAAPAMFFSIGGGTRYPMFAVADTRAGLGCAVNAPHTGSVSAAVAFFQRRGIVQLAEFCVSEPRVGAIRALQGLTGRMPVAPMVLPPRDRYDYRFRAALDELTATGAMLAYAPAGGLLTTGETSFRYHNPASGLTASAVLTDGVWEINFNGKRHRLIPAGSSIPECYIYE